MENSHANPASLAGMVLAAMPELTDPNFSQSLIFLAEHSAEGAFGLVMNRPLDRVLGQLLSDADSPTLLSSVPVYLGGPVRSEQVLLASFGKTEGGWDCVTDLPPEEMAVHVAARQSHVRAFMGYAGWGEGQLEQELDQQTWKICAPDASLFDPDLVVNLWSVYITGDDRWRELLPFLPKDPSLN